MNTKIIASLATILVVGAVAVGGTMAFFSDPGASTGNTFSAGTLSLKLSDNNETNQDNITASFGGTNLKPGDILSQQSMTVRNDGTIDANHLDLTITLDSGYSPALASAIIFPYTPDSDNGMRFGLTTNTGDSINILTYLRGDYNDGDYDLYNGTTGASLFNALPGDTEISLADIVALGKIKFVADSNNEGLIAGTQATLWIHPQIDTDLTEQGGTVTANFNWALEQDASQM